MYGVTEISVTEQVTLITFNGMPLNTSLLTEIFTSLADVGIIVDMISQTAPTGGTVSISFTCMEYDMRMVLGLIWKLVAIHPGLRPLVNAGNCKIQLYGAEMREAHGVFARALTCLSGLDAEIKQITTSEVDISLLVGAAHLEKALESVKKGFEIEKVVFN